MLLLGQPVTLDSLSARFTLRIVDQSNLPSSALVGSSQQFFNCGDYSGFRQQRICDGSDKFGEC